MPTGCEQSPCQHFNSTERAKCWLAWQMLASNSCAKCWLARKIIESKSRANLECRRALGAPSAVIGQSGSCCPTPLRHRYLRPSYRTSILLPSISEEHSTSKCFHSASRFLSVQVLHPITGQLAVHHPEPRLRVGIDFKGARSRDGPDSSWGLVLRRGSGQQSGCLQESGSGLPAHADIPSWHGTCSQ